MGWDFFRCVLSLPENFDDVPVLSVINRLDGIDATRQGLASQRRGIRAPEMGDVAEGFRLKFDLLLADLSIAIFGNGGDPVVDGEDARPGGAYRDQAHVREENLAEAAAIFVGGTGDRIIDGGDELVEGCGG